MEKLNTLRLLYSKFVNWPVIPTFNEISKFEADAEDSSVFSLIFSGLYKIDMNKKLTMLHYETRKDTG
jgi:hypothetical protein